MIAGRRFVFRPVLSICVALALAILLSLGNWQLQRLQWKNDLIAMVEANVGAPPRPLEDTIAAAQTASPTEYTPVVAEGAFIEDSAARVFGTYGGEPGVYVFEALRTESGDVVYVNRGFAPQAIDQSQVTRAPSGDTAVTGLLRYPERPTPPASWFRTAEKTADGLWFVRDPARFAGDTASERVIPFYIDQFAVADADWPLGGVTRLEFNNRHLEYALTWFGLAGALLAVWVAASFQKKSNQSTLQNKA